jgi:hypothetical protein
MLNGNQSGIHGPDVDSLVSGSAVSTGLTGWRIGLQQTLILIKDWQ